MKTSETLNLAADLIQRRGWIAGEGWPRQDRADAPLCTEGAIMAATGLQGRIGGPTPDLHKCPAYVAVREYLNIAPSVRLYRWNDHPNRTASEVIEVLRAAAAIEQAREDQDAAFATYADQVTA